MLMLGAWLILMESVKQTDCQGIKTMSYDKVKVEQIADDGNLS